MKKKTRIGWWQQYFRHIRKTKRRNEGKLAEELNRSSSPFKYYKKKPQETTETTRRLEYQGREAVDASMLGGIGYV